VELTLAEIKAKIAELQDAAVEIRKSGIQKIVDLIHQVAADNEVHPTHVLADIKKEIGEPLEQPTQPVQKTGRRMGKPSQKAPLQAKLKEAGISYGANFNVAQLKELVEKHNL
jgi:hypothetical protein